MTEDTVKSWDVTQDSPPAPTSRVSVVGSTASIAITPDGRTWKLIYLDTRHTS